MFILSFRWWIWTKLCLNNGLLCCPHWEKKKEIQLPGSQHPIENSQGNYPHCWRTWLIAPCVKSQYYLSLLTGFKVVMVAGSQLQAEKEDRCTWGIMRHSMRHWFHFLLIYRHSVWAIRHTRLGSQDFPRGQCSHSHSLQGVHFLVGDIQNRSTCSQVSV